MAECTTASSCCYNDPNFAIICVFFDKFAGTCGVDKPNIKKLQEMLENTDEVLPDLEELYTKLLRKLKKNVPTGKWEKALSKFCHTYSNQDAWEIERFGYKKASLQVKLRALKALLESQFDVNTKFKSAVNGIAANELRSEPIGRDKLGNAYWCTLDEQCNIHIYQENSDDETWKVVASSREELANLIEMLKGNQPIGRSLADIVDEDSSSNSICLQPVKENEEKENKELIEKLPTLQEPKKLEKLEKLKNEDQAGDKEIGEEEEDEEGEEEEEEESEDSNAAEYDDSDDEKDGKTNKDKPNVSLILSRRTYKDNFTSKTVVTESGKKKKVEEVKKPEKQEKLSIMTLKTKIKIPPKIQPVEEYSDDGDEEGEEEVEEEEDEEMSGEEEQDDEVGEEIEEPVKIIHGEGSGKANKSIPIPEFSEEIEESVFFVYGEGSGVQNLVGNPEKKEENKTASPSKSQFFFGSPVQRPQTSLFGSPSTTSSIFSSITPTLSSVPINKEPEAKNGESHESNVPSSSTVPDTQSPSNSRGNVEKPGLTNEEKPQLPQLQVVTDLDDKIISKDKLSPALNAPKFELKSEKKIDEKETKSETPKIIGSVKMLPLQPMPDFEVIDEKKIELVADKYEKESHEKKNEEDQKPVPDMLSEMTDNEEKSSTQTSDINSEEIPSELEDELLKDDEEKRESSQILSQNLVKVTQDDDKTNDKTRAKIEGEEKQQHESSSKNRDTKKQVVRPVEYELEQTEKNPVSSASSKECVDLSRNSSSGQQNMDKEKSLNIGEIQPIELPKCADEISPKEEKTTECKTDTIKVPDGVSNTQEPNTENDDKEQIFDPQNTKSPNESTVDQNTVSEREQKEDIFVETKSSKNKIVNLTQTLEQKTTECAKLVEAQTAVDEKLTNIKKDENVIEMSEKDIKVIENAKKKNSDCEKPSNLPKSLENVIKSEEQSVEIAEIIKDKTSNFAKPLNSEKSSEDVTKNEKKLAETETTVCDKFETKLESKIITDEKPSSSRINESEQTIEKCDEITYCVVTKEDNKNEKEDIDQVAQKSKTDIKFDTEFSEKTDDFNKIPVKHELVDDENVAIKSIQKENVEKLEKEKTNDIVEKQQILSVENAENTETTILKLEEKSSSDEAKKNLPVENSKTKNVELPVQIEDEGQNLKLQSVDVKTTEGQKEKLDINKDIQKLSVEKDNECVKSLTETEIVKEINTLNPEQKEKATEEQNKVEKTETFRLAKLEDISKLSKRENTQKDILEVTPVGKNIEKILSEMVQKDSENKTIGINTVLDKKTPKEIDIECSSKLLSERHPEETFEEQKSEKRQEVASISCESSSKKQTIETCKTSKSNKDIQSKVNQGLYNELDINQPKPGFSVENLKTEFNKKPTLQNTELEIKSAVEIKDKEKFEKDMTETFSGKNQEKIQGVKENSKKNEEDIPKDHLEKAIEKQCEKSQPVLEKPIEKLENVSENLFKKHSEMTQHNVEKHEENKDKINEKASNINRSNEINEIVPVKNLAQENIEKDNKKFADKNPGHDEKNSKLHEYSENKIPMQLETLLVKNNDNKTKVPVEKSTQENPEIRDPNSGKKTLESVPAEKHSNPKKVDEKLSLKTHDKICEVAQEKQPPQENIENANEKPIEKQSEKPGRETANKLLDEKPGHSKTPSKDHSTKINLIKETIPKENLKRTTEVNHIVISEKRVEKLQEENVKYVLDKSEQIQNVQDSIEQKCDKINEKQPEENMKEIDMIQKGSHMDLSRPTDVKESLPKKPVKEVLKAETSSTLHKQTPEKCKDVKDKSQIGKLENVHRIEKESTVDKSQKTIEKQEKSTRENTTKIKDELPVENVKKLSSEKNKIADEKPQNSFAKSQEMKDKSAHNEPDENVKEQSLKVNKPMIKEKISVENPDKITEAHKKCENLDHVKVKTIIEEKQLKMSPGNTKVIDVKLQEPTEKIKDVKSINDLEKLQEIKDKQEEHKKLDEKLSQEMSSKHQIVKEKRPEENPVKNTEAHKKSSNKTPEKPDYSKEKLENTNKTTKEKIIELNPVNSKDFGSKHREPTEKMKGMKQKEISEKSKEIKEKLPGDKPDKHKKVDEKLLQESSSEHQVAEDMNIKNSQNAEDKVLLEKSKDSEIKEKDHHKSPEKQSFTLNKIVENLKQLEETVKIDPISHKTAKEAEILPDCSKKNSDEKSAETKPVEKVVKSLPKLEIKKLEREREKSRVLEEHSTSGKRPLSLIKTPPKSNEDTSTPKPENLSREKSPPRKMFAQDKPPLNLKIDLPSKEKPLSLISTVPATQLKKIDLPLKKKIQQDLAAEAEKVPNIENKNESSASPQPTQTPQTPQTPESSRSIWPLKKKLVASLVDQEESHKKQKTAETEATDLTQTKVSPEKIEHAPETIRRGRIKIVPQINPNKPELHLEMPQHPHQTQEPPKVSPTKERLPRIKVVPRTRMSASPEKPLSQESNIPKSQMSPISLMQAMVSDESRVLSLSKPIEPSVAKTTEVTQKAIHIDAIDTSNSVDPKKQMDIKELQKPAKAFDLQNPVKAVELLTIVDVKNDPKPIEPQKPVKPVAKTVDLKKSTDIKNDPKTIEPSKSMKTVEPQKSSKSDEPQKPSKVEPQKSSKSGESKKSSKVEPQKPIKVSEPQKPIKDVEQQKPIKVVEPQKTIKAVEPQRIKVVELQKPVKTVEPQKPVKTVEPQKTITAVEPKKLIKDVEPQKPIKEPPKPFKVAEPKKPIKDVEPQKPIETAEPQKPIKAIEPEKVATNVKDVLKSEKLETPHKKTEKLPVKPVEPAEPSHTPTTRKAKLLEAQKTEKEKRNELIESQKTVKKPVQAQKIEKKPAEPQKKPTLLKQPVKAQKETQKPVDGPRTRKRRLSSHKSVSESDDDHFVDMGPTDMMSSDDEEVVPGKKARMRGKQTNENVRVQAEQKRKEEVIESSCTEEESKKPTRGKKKAEVKKVVQKTPPKPTRSTRHTKVEEPVEDPLNIEEGSKSKIKKTEPLKEEIKSEEEEEEEELPRTRRSGAKGKANVSVQKVEPKEEAKVEPVKKGAVKIEEDTKEEDEKTTPKKRGRKKLENSFDGLQLPAAGSEADSELPVRQSRRIAQQKIKEENDRRLMEEKLLRQMKAEAVKKKKDAGTYNPDEDDDDDYEDPKVDEDSKDSSKKTKKKKKKDKPWQTSSDESSSDTEQEDDLMDHDLDEEDIRHQKIAVKSDHEFSPESDDDEDQIVPMKRARTVKKEKTHEETDEEEDSNPDHACQKCNKTDHPEWILLCDICDKGYHCSCLVPVLFLIPEGDWYCPLCQHQKLIENLEAKVIEYDALYKKFEIAENRRKRLEFVELNVGNVIEQEKTERKKERKAPTKRPPPTKRKGNRSDESDSDSDSESGSSGSSKSGSGSSSDSEKSKKKKKKKKQKRSDESTAEFSSEDDEPIYKFRKRTQISVSYRFSEYDDLINSAIRKDMDENKGAGNAGRGKDIQTIIDADKEEKAKQKELESKHVQDGDLNEEDKKDENEKEKEKEKDDDDESEDDIIRRPMIKGLKGRKKKKKKLNNLDATSEEDSSSDEDFKGVSESTDEEENFSDPGDSESSLDLPRKKGRKSNSRKSARRRRRDRDFINDGDDDELMRPRRKRKKKEWDEFEEDFDDDDDEESEDINSEELCEDTGSSDSDWGSNKKKKGRGKPAAAIAARKASAGKRKPKGNDDSDKAFKPSISTKKSKVDAKSSSSGSSSSSSSESDKDGPRKTRGKKLLYLMDDDLESSDDGIRPGVKRPDTPPEERAAFIKKQEEIKRMLAEKNTEAAKALATPKLPGVKPEALDSLSTVPANVIETAKALDADFIKSSKHIDSDEFDDDFPDLNPEDMDEEELAKMMEEEDFAQHQLKLAGEAIARNRKLKEAGEASSSKKQTKDFLELDPEEITKGKRKAAKKAKEAEMHAVSQMSEAQQPTVQPLVHSKLGEALTAPKVPFTATQMPDMQPHHLMGTRLPFRMHHQQMRPSHLPPTPQLHPMMRAGPPSQQIRSGPPSQQMRPGPPSQQMRPRPPSQPMHSNMPPHNQPYPPHPSHQHLPPHIRPPLHMQPRPQLTPNQRPPSLIQQQMNRPPMPMTSGPDPYIPTTVLSAQHPIPAQSPNKPPTMPPTLPQPQPQGQVPPPQLNPDGTKKRGRRKKITPLREDLHPNLKMQPSPLTSVAQLPPTTVTTTPSPQATQSVLQTLKQEAAASAGATPPREPPAVPSLSISSPVNTKEGVPKLSVAGAPHLFNPVASNTPSVITRLLQPTQTRPPGFTPTTTGAPPGVRYYPPPGGQIKGSPQGVRMPPYSEPGAGPPPHLTPDFQGGRPPISSHGMYRPPGGSMYGGPRMQMQPYGHPGMHTGGPIPPNLRPMGPRGMPQDYPGPYGQFSYYSPTHPPQLHPSRSPNDRPSSSSPTFTTLQPVPPTAQRDRPQNSPVPPPLEEKPELDEDPSPKESGSEFGGLVSYFSSQHDDLNG